MGSTPDTTAVGLDATGRCAYVFVTLRHMNTTTVEDVTRTTDGTYSGMPNAPSITPTNNNCLIFAVGFLDDDNIEGAVTAPSGFTLENDADSGTTGFTVMVAYQIQTTATTVDPAVFGGSGTDSWRAHTYAIRHESVT